MPQTTVDFTFEPVRETDLPPLRRWLMRPHVARWWGAADSIDELRAKYLLDVDAPNATRAYIAAQHGAPIGFIQCHAVLGSGDGWGTTKPMPARGEPISSSRTRISSTEDSARQCCAPSCEDFSKTQR